VASGVRSRCGRLARVLDGPLPGDQWAGPAARPPRAARLVPRKSPGTGGGADVAALVLG
jgi:hypothetical protein